MNKAETLRRELAHAVNEYNLTLGVFDKAIEQTIWRAVYDAAAKAFEYQQKADIIRASNHSEFGPAFVEAEAACREIMADGLRDLANTLINSLDTIPSIAREAHLSLGSVK